MSSRIEEMRSDISKVYLNTSWKEKVARMPYKQVMAIYYDFLARGMFGHVPKPIIAHKSEKSLTNAEDCLRTIFELEQAQQLSLDI